MRIFECATCHKVESFLNEFPGGVCLDCYKETPAASRPVTAVELAQMWQ